MSRSSKKEPPRISDLLGQKPFEPFPDFNVSELPSDPDDWIEKKFQDGKPFILRGFNNLLAWTENSELLKTETLAGLVRSNKIKIDHCVPNGPLRELPSFKKYLSEYMNTTEDPDVDCPETWQRAIRTIVPKNLQRLGPRDLARYLPERHQSHVTVVNVGNYGSLYDKPLLLYAS
ncbi:Zinc finger, ZZ type [Aspergillus sclerotialis]|uniref:Zinc finger, ZZ type n=1 Tax=Aspergillus sclerotialis TaxID=2070753 RepID=A0A3A2ZH47_9EURO|nr:Zinc finger, ZZ type [Aspergillus sclerotialis]